MSSFHFIKGAFIMSEDDYRETKDRELAEFLKNANKLADNDDLFISAGRKKIRGVEYFMRMQKTKYDFSTLSKNALQIIFFCEQYVDFFNIVTYSKKDIIKELNIKQQNFRNAYIELVKKKILLNTNFSRKYLVMHPQFGFKGSVKEWKKLLYIIEILEYESNNDITLKYIKNFFDEKYLDILRRKNENKRFDDIKKSKIITKAKTKDVRY